MTGNGAGPKVTDLSAILERTKPAEVLRINLADVRQDALTLYELADVGRALELTPAELAAKTKAGRDSWATVDLGQAFAWVIARRERPELTWQEARTFALDFVGSPPDPTPPGVARRSRRAGTAGRSSATG